MIPKHPWLGLVFVLVVCFAAAGIGGAVTTPKIVNGTYTPLDPRQRGGLVPSEDDGYRDANYLLRAFQTKTIVSGALFEGWSFFATIAYLIEGNFA